MQIRLDLDQVVVCRKEDVDASGRDDLAAQLVRSVDQILLLEDLRNDRDVVQVDRAKACQLRCEGVDNVLPPGLSAEAQMGKSIQKCSS